MRSGILCKGLPAQWQSNIYCSEAQYRGESSFIFDYACIVSDHDGAMPPGAHGMSGVPLSTAATLIVYEAVRHHLINGSPDPTKVLH